MTLSLAQNLDDFGIDVASLHARFFSHGHPDHFVGPDAVVARLRRARAGSVGSDDVFER